MRFVDVTSSPRVSALLDLANSLSRLSEPGEALDAFVAGMGDLSADRRRCVAQLATDDLPAGAYRLLRLRTTDGIDLIPPVSPWERGSVPVRHGGLLGKLVATALPKLAHDLEASADPVLGDTLAGFRCAMAAPTFADGAASGWAIIFDSEPEAYALRDLEELILRTNLVSATMGNLHVARELFAANVRIQQQLEQVATIQRNLLPPEIPDIPGLRIAVSYETCDRSGGDLYDLMRVAPSDDRWAILIGDVSGHGPAAAVVMAMVHSILGTYPGRPAGPAQLLTYVNAQLCSKRMGQAFVTAFLAFYEPASRRLTYSRAGHLPPLLRPASPADPIITIDAAGGLPLAVDPQATYEDAELTVEPGQLLLLYTDGITESGGAGGELLGVDALKLVLRRAPADAQATIDRIRSAVEMHQSMPTRCDDQTLLALGFMPS